MTNKFVTFLQHLGLFFKDYIQPVVINATPFISMINPGIGAAMSLIESMVIAIEQRYAAVGMQSGTGPQKMAAVLNIVTPAVIQLMAAEGITADQSTVQGMVQKTVDLFNSIPAPVTKAA